MSTRSWRLRSLLVIATVSLMSSGCAWVQRVNVDSAGEPRLGRRLSRAISADGRYIAFDSYSSLVAGDTNNLLDVFVRDMAAGRTTRVSVDSTGNQANGSSSIGAVSANGRYVAFVSGASNLVAGDTNNHLDVFVRDTVAGSTSRVSVSRRGQPRPTATASTRRSRRTAATSPSVRTRRTWLRATRTARATCSCGTRWRGTTRPGEPSTVRAPRRTTTANSPAISADGRYVAFDSFASNLVAGDTNGNGDMFVRDTVGGQTTTGERQQRGVTRPTSQLLRRRSRPTATTSRSNRHVEPRGGRHEQNRDVFVRDTVAGTTTRVSVDSAGIEVDGDS